MEWKILKDMEYGKFHSIAFPACISMTCTKVVMYKRIRCYQFRNVFVRDGETIFWDVIDFVSWQKNLNSAPMTVIVKKITVANFVPSPKDSIKNVNFLV